MKPILSIITINRNNAAGLEKTVDSVLSQTNDLCEYIVVDGDSDDESKEIIGLNKDHITKIIIEPNAGIYGSMNIGIRIAKGTYCLFLNSGDWLCENIIKRALNECTGEDIIYFKTILSYPGTIYEEIGYDRQLTLKSFYNSTIGHQTTFIKKSLFERYGFYNEANKLHSDYEFWLKALIQHNCNSRYVDFPLAYYDMTGRTSAPSIASTMEIEKIKKIYIPMRILEDYDYWQTYKAENVAFEWVKQKKYMSMLIKLVFNVAKSVAKLRKRLT